MPKKNLTIIGIENLGANAYNFLKENAYLVSILTSKKGIDYPLVEAAKKRNYNFSIVENDYLEVKKVVNIEGQKPNTTFEHLMLKEFLEHFEADIQEQKKKLLYNAYGVKIDKTMQTKIATVFASFKKYRRGLKQEYLDLISNSKDLKDAILTVKELLELNLEDKRKVESLLVNYIPEEEVETVDNSFNAIPLEGLHQTTEKGEHHTA